MVTQLKWNKFTKTRIGFFYEGAQGTPISYVYARGNLLQDTFFSSALIFIPAKQTDIVLVQLIATPSNPNPNPLTPQQQWEALSSFIEGNEY
jgi:hypothetical protein